MSAIPQSFSGQGLNGVLYSAPHSRAKQQALAFLARDWSTFKTTADFKEAYQGLQALLQVVGYDREARQQCMSMLKCLETYERSFEKWLMTDYQKELKKIMDKVIEIISQWIPDTERDRVINILKSFFEK